MSSFLLQAVAIESAYYSNVSGALQREWRNISGIIKVNIYQAQQEKSMLEDRKDYLSEINYGDKIEFIGNLSIPSTSRNSGQFDYKYYLKRQNPRVEATASVVSLNNIIILSKGNGNSFYTFVYGLKRKLNMVIEKNVKEEIVPLVSSILLGDWEKVAKNLMDGFLKTGTTHFLAISGLHVGILVISLHYLLRLFRLNTRYLAMVIILIVFFYAAITGMVSPILVTPFACLVSYSGVALENLILLFSKIFQTFFYTSTSLWDMDCLKLTCFDVRHGASFFIQFPNGKNMLFDSGTKGNYDVGKFVVAPFLRQHGIKKIDTVVISHEHDDHCNGILSIIDRFSVGNVFVNKFYYNPEIESSC